MNGPGRVESSSVAAPSTVESGFSTYALTLNNGVVTASINGVNVLTGAMFTPPAGDLPTSANVAAVGDITSDASSTYELTNFTVSVVPEPIALPILAISGLLAKRNGRQWRA